MAPTSSKYNTVSTPDAKKPRRDVAEPSKNLNYTLAIASLDKINQIAPRVLPLYVIEIKNNQLTAINLKKLPPKHQIFLLNAANRGEKFDKKSILRLMQDFNVKQATETHNFDQFTCFVPLKSGKSNEILSILNAKI